MKKFKISSKKIGSLLLSLSLAIGIIGSSGSQFSAYAASSSDSNVYLSESDSKLLVEQCIADSIASDEHCTWNNQTSVESVEPVYDLNDKTAYFLFRLNAGYVFVSASESNPKVIAYSYDSSFVADNMIKQSENKSSISDEKVIYAGGLNFLTENNSSYRDLETGKTIDTSDVTNLKSLYNNKIATISDPKAQSEFKDLKTDGIESTPNLSSSDPVYYIPHLFDSDYQVYLMDDFPGYTNHCTPTAGTNFMYYWGNKADNKKSALWTGAVFEDLHTYMKTTSDGTYLENVLPGLQQYSASRNVSIVSNYNFKATSYSKCVETIQEKGPFLLLLWNDKSPMNYGNHTVLAVGTGNNYLRILDGWSDSRSNFFDSSYLSAGNDNADGVYTTY